jgi:hypothetical protein
MMPPVERAKTQFQVSYQLAGLYFDQMLDYADNFHGGGADARAKPSLRVDPIATGRSHRYG